MRLTDQEYKEIVDRHNRAKNFVKPVPEKPKKGMNGLESQYAQKLELEKKAGMIRDWKFEPFKLRLADRTYYSPDFLVVKNDCIEIHETKGFMRDDANVKLKVAAEQFPWFKFVLVKRNSSNRNWEFKEY